MLSIDLCLTKKTGLPADPATTVPHFETAELSGQVTGDHQHLETSSFHVFVVGTIQHDWFYRGAGEAEIQALATDINFVKSLNGHFSAVIIPKQAGPVTAIASRVGGLRLYCRQSATRILISSRLSSLQQAQPDCLPSPVALKEEFEYRWLTGFQSLLQDVYQLAPGSLCHLVFADGTAPVFEQYWRFPLQVASSHSMAEHVDNMRALLKKSLMAQLRPGARVAVLLSGGVDSSVLAGIAQETGCSFTAFSHDSPEHGNPELATAREFAKSLGVEHQVISFPDSEVPAVFMETTKIIEQAPRFQSSLILYKLFAVMSGKFDQVIYGEAADTLCGSNMVKRYYKRSRKRNLARLACLNSESLFNVVAAASGNANLKSLATLKPTRHLQEEQRLSVTAWESAWITRNFGATGDGYELLGELYDNRHGSASALMREIAQVKALNLRSDITNHLHETCTLANHFGLDVVTPFMTADVMEYASRLDFASYGGEQYVKPVLRIIGEKYYPRDLLYLPKKGFPAPYESWMETVLAPLWQAARGKAGLPETTTHKFSTEFKWTVAALAQIFPQMPGSAGQAQNRAPN